MIEITFEYYDGSNDSRPPMSNSLYSLIECAVNSVGAAKCHVVHVGTVGDRRHTWGKHILKPPEAIDVLKVFLEWNDGRKVALELGDADEPTTETHIFNRHAVAMVWEANGGETAHKDDKRKGHIHLETP